MTYEDQTIKPGIEQYIPLDWVRHLEWIRFTYETEVSVDALGRAGFIEFLIRKLAHLSTFLVLGFSLVDLTRRAVPSFGIAAIFAYSLAITFAVFDEFHQILRAGGTGWWWKSCSTVWERSSASWSTACSFAKGGRTS